MEYSIKYLIETFSFELSRRIEKLELGMFKIYVWKENIFFLNEKNIFRNFLIYL